MKRILMLVLLSSCATFAPRMTHARPGWQWCKAADNVISCQGKEMARIECGEPSDNSCGTLAVAYTDGERLVIAANGAERPEISSDGNQIWYRDPNVRGDVWHVFDPQSGEMQERDSMAVTMMRDRGSVPLWTRGAR